MNPTCDVLEKRIAAFEGGVASLAVSSGQAATVMAIQNIARNGDNIVSSTDVYGGTWNLFANTLKDQGIEVRFVDPADPNAFKNASDDKTRAYFGETNELLAKKVDAVLAADMQVVYCCGETLPEREANNHFRVIESQISEGLFHLDASGISEVVIAYEPVWAIGTGVTASSEQAQEVHAFIRSLIEKKYGNEIAEQISILYGGSCNPKNAEELFRQKDVDGGLIGGAALKANDFIQIANSY